MRVSCGGTLSSPRKLLSCVPQGSVLGLLLFLIYVISIADGILAKSMAFADDFKLFMHCSEENREGVLQHMRALQRDIDAITDPAVSWNLKLNADKCVVEILQGIS